MAKSKIGNRNLPVTMDELGTMKVPYGDYFLRCITSMFKLDTIVKAIWKKLTKRQLKLFKEDIFGRFMDC